jgi:MSHA biogenesis protein MshQ
MFKTSVYVLLRRLLALCCLLLGVSASATSVTGTAASCASGAGIGTVAWGAAANARAADNVYATVTVNGSTSNYLKCTGWGFAIPASARIDGVAVSVTRKADSIANGGTTDAAVRLIKSSAVGSVDRLGGTVYPVAASTEVHGGAADLWGLTWNPAEINDTNFGVALAVKKASGTGAAEVVSVDHISVTVSYTAFSCTPPANTPAGVNLTCQCDTFERPSLQPSTIFNSNWLVSVLDTTNIAPSIVNPGYLRLTNNTGYNAKAAAVPGIFPAAGNYFSVEFRHYAYNGNGADGISVALSDYAVPAQPGGNGGSLGYAQKSGLNGFAGGWLGIALDEFGNFQNNNEGRVGGPGQVPQSVGVRGSGSGTSGYPWLKGTANLTSTAPNRGIDNRTSTMPSTGDFYQIVVDARSNNGAGGPVYASVNRDTTGGGSSYSALIAPFDVYARATALGATQAAVPQNFQVSFAGGTGGNNNIHEIGAVRICAQTFYAPSGGTLGGFNVIDSAYPRTTVNALQGHIYTKLAGSNFSLNVAALNTSNSAIEGTYAAAATVPVTLQLIDDSAGASCSASAAACTACSKPVVASQTVSFSAANTGFKASSTFNIASAYTRLIARASDGTASGCSTDAFSVRPLGFSGVSTSASNTAATGTPKFKAGTDSFSLTTTTATAGYTGTPKTSAAGMQADTSSWTLGQLFPTSFGAAVASSATGSFVYSEAGHLKFLGYAASNTSAVRGIYDDTWTAVDQGAQGDCVAGSYANTVNANGKVGCAFGLLADSPLMGRFVPDHFALASSTLGVPAGGFVYMGQSALTLGYQLEARAGAAFSNAVVTNYAAARGYAVATPTLVAEDQGSANQACDLASRIGGLAAGSWISGVYSVGPALATFSRPLAPNFSNAATCAAIVATGPGPFNALDIGVAINDSDADAALTEPALTPVLDMNTGSIGDCTLTANCTAKKIGSTQVLFGRAKISNAYGSPQLPLAVPLELQSWQGSNFVRNTLDSLTALTLPASTTLAAASVPTGNPNLYFSSGSALTSAATQATWGTPLFVSGRNTLNFSAPDTAHPGSVDILLPLPGYLQGNWGNCLGQTGAAGLFDDNVCAKATFGVFKSTLIYRRENY